MSDDKTEYGTSVQTNKHSAEIFQFIDHVGEFAYVLNENYTLSHLIFVSAITAQIILS